MVEIRIPSLQSQQLGEPPARRAATGSSETLEVPSTNPAMWRAYWAEHGHRHDPKQRLRRGNPYSPSVSLYELEPVAARSPRRGAGCTASLPRETGKLTRFDPHDFVLIPGTEPRRLGCAGRGVGGDAGLVGRTAAGEGAWRAPPRAATTCGLEVAHLW